MKHELFNRHKKYKHLRPIFAICEKSSKMSLDQAMERIQDEFHDCEDSEPSPGSNLVARAWWQFAITSVIRDNR